MILYNEFLKGGPVMWPLLLLSVGSVSCALERTLFWTSLLRQEEELVHNVLQTAARSLSEAAVIARNASNTPIGRFLLAPLVLNNPSPETFRLAMEAAADKEFAQMRKGDKYLETVVALGPLLGLLGTVTGLINTFSNLIIGGGGSSEQASKAAAGIGEALISTAGGMLVAILALIIFRVLVALQGQQIEYFLEVGSKLELIYRQFWHEAGVNTNGLVHVAEPEAELTHAT